MKNAQWRYHRNRPEGQVFDITPEMATKLEREGWVDTPAKLPPELRNAYKHKGQPVPQVMPPVAVTTAAGRALSPEPVPAAVAPKTPADLRMAQLFDADGDRADAALIDEELVRLTDDMSREEVVHSLDLLGRPGADSEWTFRLRTDLIDALRPDADLDAIFGASDSALAMPTEEPGEPANEPGEPETDASDVTVDQLKAMDEEHREAWLLDPLTTKKRLQQMLTELGQQFRSNAGKEDLQEAIRATLAG